MTFLPFKVSDFKNILPQPYMKESNFEFKLVREDTYNNLLEIYDKSLQDTLKTISPEDLQKKIYLFNVQMVPENMNWRLWKNEDEIRVFYQKIQTDIIDMNANKDRKLDNGDQIMNLNNSLGQFFQSSAPVDLTFVNNFTIFLNKLAQNHFIQKCEQYLLFVQHCMPIDKWNMKTFKHLIVYKTPSFSSKFIGMFKSETDNRVRDFYLTITSDGILKSDNHLLESRINFMIPFTNQLTIQCKTSKEKYITYTLQSCAHEQLIIKFYGEYINAINFIVALKMALGETSYADNRFKSYSRIRQNCAAKLYNDGEFYYSDMYDCLKGAKWQVCITGWMITPYFLLKRPNSIENKEYRLDGVLQQLAQRGVKVYIVAFMEPKMFVNNDSEHVQIYLESLHDNIKVYRHPNDKIPSLWSHHQKMVIVDQKIGFMGGLDICYGRWDRPDHLLKDPGLLWDGADYNNYRTRDIAKPRDYKNSNLAAQGEPRMPWHDIALQFRGDIVIDLLRHFVQYWYFVKSQLLADPLKTANFLQRRYEQAFSNPKSEAEREEMKYNLTQLQKNQQSNTFMQKMGFMINGRQERLTELLIQARPGLNVGTDRLQMCRSASQWSIGVRPGQHESSIHEAYLDLIENSREFIYIENQFFMGLQNKIVETIAKRIIRAKNQHKPFKIIVVMPLLPGFEGNIADPKSTVLRIQVYYQYLAILRGKDSLFQRLKQYNINMNDYIYFFGLRQSQIVDNVPTTEIIYVHSKLMIVDDCRAIIGSANINDRSLLGTRDSELACIIEQQNGNIFDLRCRLFDQHFGLNRQESKQFPQNQHIWNKIIQNSKRATLFYREVFGCIPDDFVTTGMEVSKYARTPTVQGFLKGRKTLSGHAVDFPLQFMKDEDLRFKISQKQYYVPQMSFT